MKLSLAGARHVPFTLALALALASAGCADSLAVDAGAAVDATAPPLDGPPFVLRPLRPTAVQSLLLDPFLTNDVSWGHFFAEYLTTTGDAGVRYANLFRSYASDSPVGASAPIVEFRDLAAHRGNATDVVMLAAFSGSRDAVDARIWVAVDSADGTPSTLERHTPGIEVALLASVGEPGSAGGPDPLRYVLVPDPATTRTIMHRTWVALHLAAPAMVPEGGYFSVTITDFAPAWLLAAPEVAPDAARRAARNRDAVSAPLTPRDREAIRAYDAYVSRNATGARRAPSHPVVPRRTH